MIDPKAEPIGHRSPYKRIDLAARRRPRTITREAIEDNLVPAPDPDEYWCDPYGNWHLHEDQ